MTLIFPFNGYRYNEIFNPLDNLIAPPFDEISESRRNQLLSHQYNFVNFTLPDDYSIPKVLVEKFIRNGIFVIDSPSYYLLEIEYDSKILRGLLGGVDLAGNIYPHEKTFESPVNDRFNLLSSSEFDFEPVYFLSSVNFDYEKLNLLSYGSLDNNIFRLYRIDLKTKDLGNLVIADGHHRFQAALHFYWKYEKYNRILGFVTNIHDKNIVLKNANKKLKRNMFDLNKLKETFDFTDYGLKFIYDSKIFFIVPKNNDLFKLPQIFWFIYLLDILHIEYSINNVITYFYSSCDVNYVCFYPEPPKVNEVYSMAINGLLFPQKSTYFLPKPASGLVFMKK
ncbi:MAG: DUF1015 family protein [Thermoplasmata archaeon]